MGERSQTSLLPELSVRRGLEALEFYEAAFGAVEVYRVGGTEENGDVVAQLSVGGASFWVSDESPPNKNFSPESLGGSTVRLLLIVDDPHSVVERAVALGAAEVSPVAEEHQWLQERAPTLSKQSSARAGARIRCSTATGSRVGARRSTLERVIAATRSGPVYLGSRE